MKKLIPLIRPLYKNLSALTGFKLLVLYSHNIKLSQIWDSFDQNMMKGKHNTLLISY